MQDLSNRIEGTRADINIFSKISHQANFDPSKPSWAGCCSSPGWAPPRKLSFNFTNQNVIAQAELLFPFAAILIGQCMTVWLLFPSYRVREFSHALISGPQTRMFLCIRTCLPCQTKSSPERIPAPSSHFLEESRNPLSTPFMSLEGIAWSIPVSTSIRWNGTQEERSKENNTRRCAEGKERQGKKQKKFSETEPKAKLKIRRGDFTPEISLHTPTAHHNFSVSASCHRALSFWRSKNCCSEACSSTVHILERSTAAALDQLMPHSPSLTVHFVVIIVPHNCTQLLRARLTIASDRNHHYYSKSSIKKSTDQLTRRIHIILQQKSVRSNAESSTGN